MTARRAVRLALASLLAAGAAAAQTWTAVAAPGPSPRRNAAAVHDPEGGRVVLFGGRDSSGDRNDVWAFDLASRTWRQVEPAGADPAPTPRFTHNAVYDPAGRRALIWSGRSVTSAGSVLLNDVWAFDLEAQRWQALPVDGDPPTARYGTAAVFDPRAAALVTFAGFTTRGRFDDTWRFEPATGRWRDVSAPVRPGERCLHAAAYDSRRHRMIVFGGQRGDASLDDAWALDLDSDTWQPLASAPAGRRFPATAYEAASDRFLSFGGEATDGSRGGQLWALDLGADRWSEVTTAGPPPRDGAVLVHTGGPQSPRLLLFGGTGDAGHLGDTWLLPLEPVVTAVTDGAASGPVAPSLAAHPNPFNAAVALEVTLPAAGRLVVCDALGRRVRALGERPAGRHRLFWDGSDDSGRPAASGVYLAVLHAGAARRAVRIALVR